MRNAIFEGFTINLLILKASVFIIILATATYAYPQNYFITDLGSVNVLDINNSGQVLGNSSSGSFIWSNGSTTDLSFYATDINNSGQVVGFSSVPSVGSNQYVNVGTDVIKWSNGVTDIIADGNVNYLPYLHYQLDPTTFINPRINDVGSVYVTFQTSFPAPFIGVLENGASSWKLLGGSYGSTFDDQLYAINNNDQLVGYNTSGHPFVYTEGYSIDLYGEILGAYSINDAGQVVGWSRNGAYLWDNGNMTVLGSGSALDINKSGQIVGLNGGYATLWDNGMQQDLNTLINDPTWLLTSATSINDLGQIIGTGLINGETHSFLLNPSDPTPVPEPSTMLLLGSGLAGFIWFRLKQIKSANYIRS